jgi:hypothetical protein
MNMIDSTSANVNVNPATSARDSWPDWVDSDRWVPTDDDNRPTADFGFVPTIADDNEAAEMFGGSCDLLDAGDDHDDDLEWDRFVAEREESAFSDPYDLLSPNELIESRGNHPAGPDYA